ncbi:hypothetical protein ACN47E_006577 [Coniothyrium glycines]
MASRTSTPQSRSRSASGSSNSSDTTMIDAPPQPPSRPVRLRHASRSMSSSNEPTITLQTAACDPSFSLLLSLPRELRDRVYSYALASPYVLEWPGTSPPGHKHDINVGLLRTNRQVFEEAEPVLYSLNKFLFAHPSDCNIFRVVSSPASKYINSAHFRIRERDLRLWTGYLGSKSADRSLGADLPKLKSLVISMRCGSMGNLGQLGGAHGLHGLAPGVQMQVQAVQNALGQQVHALQQQVQNLTHVMANAQPLHPHHPHAPATPSAPQLAALIATPPQNNPLPPPPPPPAPAMPLAPHAAEPGAVDNDPHAHPLYSSFLRFEREMGLESLCLSLHDTLSTANTSVKIVCIMRVPRREVARLVALYPEELSFVNGSASASGSASGGIGDARTVFKKLHGLEVSLELSGYGGDHEGW